MSSPTLQDVLSLANRLPVRDQAQLAHHLLDVLAERLELIEESAEQQEDTSAWEALIDALDAIGRGPWASERTANEMLSEMRYSGYVHQNC